MQLLQQQLSSVRLTQTEKTVESTGVEEGVTAQENHPLLEKELKVRITSYNVCYTKLLRGRRGARPCS